MRSDGNTFREGQINAAIYLLDQTFEDDPSYVPDGVEVWGTNRRIHPRIFEDTYRSTSPASANIQTMIHEPIYLGDIFLWPEHGYWLCRHATNLHGIQWKGTLYFCNYIIHFISPATGEIINMPVGIINATQYGTGEKQRYDRELKLQIGVSDLIMYAQYNQHTQIIDSGFRFLIDRNPKQPTVFEVKQADMVSYSDSGNRGYIHFTVAEDQFNPKTDNKELLIANYYPDEVGTAKELETKTNLWL